MNKLIVLSLTSVILLACDGPTKPSKQTVSVVDSSNLTIKTNDPQNLSQTTITITKSMLDNPTKIKLSELVDDITFLKLETRKESLVKYTKYTVFTKDFIFFEDKVFTWDGKWKVNVGAKGRGPYEEPEGVTNLAFKDGKFYSKESKLIEYDINGKPTKKVRNLYGEETPNKGVGSNLFYGGVPMVVGKYLIFAGPDALYFVNPENLKTELRMELIPNKIKTEFSGSNGTGHISFYRDNTLLFNPYVDTVFYVKNQSLLPMWRLQIDRDMKMPMEFFHKSRELLLDFSKGGTKSYQMRSGKVRLTKVYETNNYLFLRIRRFQIDGSKDADVYYICYGKKTKISKVVLEKDFVDDVFGLGAYKLQIFDEKILMELWPHEIFDIIAKKKKAGEKIHPKLAALAEQIDEGDNPIIFVAHLKK